MPPTPAVSTVSALACALATGGCGSPSPPADNHSRLHVAAAAEDIHRYNRHASRFTKEPK
ncbi:MAG: hypothetical protein OXF54_04575 [Caldilineaceae bacterium]|nr:hypothetical protein [Caldilineaceae bacterium]